KSLCADFVILYVIDPSLFWVTFLIPCSFASSVISSISTSPSSNSNKLAGIVTSTLNRFLSTSTDSSLLSDCSFSPDSTLVVSLLLLFAHDVNMHIAIIIKINKYFFTVHLSLLFYFSIIYTDKLCK